MKALLCWIFLLTGSALATEYYLPIPLPGMNGNLQELNHDYPTGFPVTLGGVPFNILSSGNNYFNAEFAAPGTNQVVTWEVPINEIGISEIHVLINTYWGESISGTYASLTFKYEDESEVVSTLDGNRDMRDYVNNDWTNSINGGTTTQVFHTDTPGNAGDNPYRLDKLYVDLSAHSSKRLLSVVLTDRGASEVQRVFISGITVRASPYTVHLDVPVLKQGTPPWNSEPMPTGVTIGSQGCAITCLTMMLRSFNYHEVNLGTEAAPDIRELDPGTFNTWLIKNGGYSTRNVVSWPTINTFTKNRIQFKEMVTGMYPDVINSDIEHAIPTVVRVKGISYPTKDHFVLASGAVVDPRLHLADYFLIRDPALTGAYDITDPPYNRFYKGHVRYKIGDGVLRPALSLMMHSPAELLVMDKDGRRCGYDPGTGTLLYEILGGSAASFDGIDDPTGIVPADPEHKELHLTNADNGPYRVTAVGTGTGDYHINISSTDSMGEVTLGKISGRTFPGKIDTFLLNDNSGSSMSLKSPGALKGGATLKAGSQQVIVTCNLASDGKQVTGRLDFHLPGSGKKAQAISFDIAVFQDGFADLAGVCTFPGAQNHTYSLTVEQRPAQKTTLLRVEILDPNKVPVYSGAGTVNGSLKIAY